MNTNIITPPKYQNVSRKGYMTKIENDLISHFEAKGAHDGKNNMPETETEYQAMVVNDIQTTMQHEINLNYQEPM
ncbi:MAG: hypothetical protein ACXVED_20500, partial [Bacteroidia bacterium]